MVVAAAAVMVVVVVVGIFFFNQVLEVAKLLHVARNVDGSFLIKTILFLGFLQQLHEEWMV